MANPFATFLPKVTRRKPNLNEEFGSFLFFIFSISEKWGLFGAFVGQCYGILRFYNPTKSSYRAIYPRIGFGVGTETE